MTLNIKVNCLILIELYLFACSTASGKSDTINTSGSDGTQESGIGDDKVCYYYALILGDYAGSNRYIYIYIYIVIYEILEGT